MSILFGFYHADKGEIRVKGQPVKIQSSSDAIALGIGMVHQHFMLVEPFTVLENVVLGAEGGALIGPALAKARAELTRLAHDYELEVDPDAIVGELPVGLQQRVEILKALFRGAETLILDEPTGVLTPDEADHLFRILGTLRDQGKTVILITHKLREIMAITDHVSVMRRGEMVATRETKNTSVEELAELMVGRHVLLQVEKGTAESRRDGAGGEEPHLEGQEGRRPRRQRVLQRAEGRDRRHRRRLRQRPVGTARRHRRNHQAHLGPGASSRARTSACWAIPRHVRAEGLAHVPEDRQHRGLIGTFDASESVSSAGITTKRWAGASASTATR